MSLARFEEGRIADMVRNVTFEEWEAEAMADPEVRAAVEALEPEYQRERARIAARLAASLKPRRGVALLDSRSREANRSLPGLERGQPHGAGSTSTAPGGVAQPRLGQ